MKDTEKGKADEPRRVPSPQSSMERAKSHEDKEEKKHPEKERTCSDVQCEDSERESKERDPIGGDYKHRVRKEHREGSKDTDRDRGARGSSRERDRCRTRNLL